jgi:hypothetical protein
MGVTLPQKKQKKHWCFIRLFPSKKKTLKNMTFWPSMAFIRLNLEGRNLERNQIPERTTRLHPYQMPQPGMPIHWMMLITTWAMNTKKNAMKLNELSVLQGGEK